jgi:branched-chain amino acid transport system ATP-binding protein
MSRTPQLAIEGISLSFGGLQVLNDVSLSVGDAELLALIGPNGAGKTTVFNCISGIYRPHGRIIFAGDDLLGLKPHQIAALGISRTFQHGEVSAHMTVLDAVLVGRHARMRTNILAELLGLPAARQEEADHRKAASDILNLCDLSQFAERPVGSLPFGTQKIVGYARALASEPTILLLDEPSAGLTQEERETMARLIMRAKRNLRLAIIWIEHDMQMVADLADRIHVLDYGRSLADGPPEEVLNHPDVVHAYLGA